MGPCWRRLGVSNDKPTIRAGDWWMISDSFLSRSSDSFVHVYSAVINLNLLDQWRKKKEWDGLYFVNYHYWTLGFYKQNPEVFCTLWPPFFHGEFPGTIAASNSPSITNKECGSGGLLSSFPGKHGNEQQREPRKLHSSGMIAVQPEYVAGHLRMAPRGKLCGNYIAVELDSYTWAAG